MADSRQADARIAFDRGKVPVDPFGSKTRNSRVGWIQLRQIPPTGERDKSVRRESRAIRRSLQPRILREVPMDNDNTIQKYDRIRGGMEGVALFTKPSTIFSIVHARYVAMEKSGKHCKKVTC
jgi:hypothetical protein